MKKIWDTQNSKPLFAIDETALYKLIRSKVSKARRSANLMETGLILINIIVIAFLINKGMNSDQGWIQFITAGIAFLVSVYVYSGRLSRKRRQSKFDQSILGELDMAISNIDYLIERGRTFIWWYLTPFSMTLLLSMYFTFDSKTVWSWMGIGIAMIFAGWLPTWEVRKFHIPKKRNLEAIKKMLMQN